MIEARGLVKKYGDTVAVGGLTFDVQPGLVTGFLGPNGSGKSTTLRMVLGLDAPTEGTVTVNGRPYNQHRHPLREVGALLEAQAIHPGRSAYNHLLGLAHSNGLKRNRVDAVPEQVGLAEAAKTRVGTFSLGMGQRLGIAAALLGDPEVLLFDEPVNGLDPEGILWIRTLMRSLDEQGRTVFVQPPDERNGRDRRPPYRHRTRGTHRPHHCPGLHQGTIAPMTTLGSGETAPDEISPTPGCAISARERCAGALDDAAARRHRVQDVHRVREEVGMPMYGRVDHLAVDDVSTAAALRS